MSKNTLAAATMLLISSFLVATATAETWPGFRGRAGSGVSSEKNLPAKWSADQGVLWKTPLTGRGNSSPAVTKTRIYLTTHLEDKSLWVLSIDRKSGKIVWKKKVGNGLLVAKGPTNLYINRHSPATPTASADETGVWAFFGTGLLVHLDRDGNMKWQRDLVKDYGSYDITFGMGSSPRLWGDLLYVSCMTKGPSYVVALNKTSGKQVWKKVRRLPAKDDGPDSYATPIVDQTKTGDQLLIAGSDHINAYDPKSGKQLWISHGLTVKTPYGRVIASPAISESGAVVVTSGNPGGSVGHVITLRGGGSGDITETHRLWKLAKNVPDSSTPVCVGKNVYMINGNGIGTCLDIATGKVLWQKRLLKGPVHAASVAGDGKVYFINIEGDCVVLKTGNEANVLSTNKLPGQFYATPAISDGVIYLRAYEALYAIGVSK